MPKQRNTIMQTFKQNLTAVIMMLMGGLAVHAATFTVTNLDDSGAGSFRQAIVDSNSAAGPDTINVAITGTVLLASSLPTIADSVTINGSGQDEFILDGGNIAALRPININGDGIRVNIRNLTVTRGVGSSLGGGIRVQGGAIVNISNVTVSQNTATGSAGIYVAESSTVFLLNSRVIGNTVTTAGGDGGGVLVSSSNFLMVGCTVSGNATATSGGSTGGGISVAISSVPGSPVAVVRIENSTISNNTAQIGGGVYNSGTGILRMSNVTVSGNSTTSTDATLPNGGGVYVNNGSATLRNLTIAGNSATGTGAGGGIYTNGASTTVISNSIVADNTSGNAASQEIRVTSTVGGTVSTRGVNVIEGTTSGTIAVTNGSNITGTDPQLSPLADNGGAVETQATTPGSVARNGGANDEALDTQDNPSSNDGRGVGFARIADSTVDIGSFEFTTAPERNRTAFDFDGDGRADISVFRPSEGLTYRLGSGSENSFGATSFGVATDQLAPADFDGDGKTDIAVFREGLWFILLSSTGQVQITQFGLAGDLPRPGDFDGDGRADIAVYRPSEGIWYRIDSSTDTFGAIQFGVSEDAAMIGDYDADGRTDYAVFRPSTGFWYVLRSSDGQTEVDAFGLTGDIPLNGDFNGDGSSDLAVFRPSTGFWYIARPTGVPAQNFNAIPFGLATDIPVAADYDGDGSADIAVFRPSDGIWYILKSTGDVAYFAFGLATDRALPSAYLP